jgi:hypothetical protein
MQVMDDVMQQVVRQGVDREDRAVRPAAGTLPAVGSDAVQDGGDPLGFGCKLVRTIDANRVPKTMNASRTWQPYSSGDHTSGWGRMSDPGARTASPSAAVAARSSSATSLGPTEDASKPHSAHGRSSTHVQSLVSASGCCGVLTSRPDRPVEP